MSLEKDPLCFQEDEVEEEIGHENYFENDVDEEEDSFCCKYCEFQTQNIEDLDEHIITHEEAFLEDDDEVDSANTDLHATANSSENSSPTGSAAPDENIHKGRLGKTTRQELPAFYDECAIKVTKRVYVCPFCGYQSMKKLDMNRHLKEHREPVELPVYACAECPYTTRRKFDMPKHLLTHCESGSVTMFNCDQCPYATKRKGDLTKHMICHATPLLNVYSCSECPYTSKRHGDLKKHLVCHDDGVETKNTLFHCTECGYTSKRLNDLHKHVVLHCDRTIKGVFKCPKCDYASASGSPFAKHVLSQCKIREMSASIFPKDGSMEEYIVLEEDDLHLYQLDKNNIPSINILEKDVDEQHLRAGQKRKKPGEVECISAKKVNFESYYVEEIEPDNSKVVVLPGFEDDQNEEN